MVHYFEKILAIDGVIGIVFLDTTGKPVFNRFVSPEIELEVSGFPWSNLISKLAGIKEADLIFENYRAYIRETKIGYLFVILELSASVALVRLNCDILIPELNKVNVKNGKKRFFA